MDNLLSNKELLAVAKILIGCKAFSREELLTIICKLKAHTSSSDKARLEALINKELFHYSEVGCDCKSVIENIWNLTSHIQSKRAITIDYYKMNRSNVKHKIKPVSIMFAEYYFYLIAYKYDDATNTPYYFRVDRIVDITTHREIFKLNVFQNFDEGLLRNRSQFMWPGPTETALRCSYLAREAG